MSEKARAKAERETPEQVAEQPPVATPDAPQVDVAVVPEPATDFAPPASATDLAEQLGYFMAGTWAGHPLYATTFDQFTTTNLAVMKEYVRGVRPDFGVRQAQVDTARRDHFGNVVREGLE